MSAPASTHRKLPGGGLSSSGRGSLWQGTDHLLEATSFLVVERYRRFFFHEIQAFVIHRSSVRFVWIWIQMIVGSLSAAGTILAVPKIITATDDLGRGFLALLVMILAPIALASLVALIVNLALGPTCRCHVLTASGWRRLTAPARLGPALEVQARIFPLIAAAQAPPPPLESAAPFDAP